MESTVNVVRHVFPLILCGYLAALPSGANCFVVAQQYGRYVQWASSAILIPTLVAALTVSVILNLPFMKG